MSKLLETTDLTKHYPVGGGLLSRHRAGTVRAVDGVSLDLERGETHALVGESGCGKSTFARLVLRLIEPTSGAIRFDGEDITAMSGERLRSLRRRMQIVFQDPFSSLNPTMRVRDIIEEPLLVHGVGDRTARHARCDELMSLVGLDLSYADRRPDEFSGGQRQRIGIARALALQPELIVCDEAVSALDVSIQAQVINLLRDLQRQFGLSYLFIAHDLAVVRHMADRVSVMYLGRVVESGPVSVLFSNPRHPYTRTLLASVPQLVPVRRPRREIIEADMPSPLAIPAGCRFHPRCAFADDICRRVEPDQSVVAAGHISACHRFSKLPDWTSQATGEAVATATARRLALYEERRTRIKPTPR